MSTQYVGTVTHYYPKIGVVGVALESSLHSGDWIRISGHTTELAETVESMEIEHRPTQVARPGEEVAIKVLDRARRGDRVFRVTETDHAEVANNRAVVHRFGEEVWNKGNLAAIDELVAPEFIGYGPGSRITRGPEQLKQVVKRMRSIFPDLRFFVDDEVADGDKVVTRWTGRGTQQATWRGTPASGQQVVMTGIAIRRFGWRQDRRALGQYQPARPVRHGQVYQVVRQKEIGELAESARDPERPARSGPWRLPERSESCFQPYD